MIVKPEFMPAVESNFEDADFQINHDHNASSDIAGMSDSDSSMGTNWDSDSNFDSDLDVDAETVQRVGILEQDTVEKERELDRFEHGMQRLADIFKDQRSKGHNAYLQKFIEANKSNILLLEEIDQMSAQRTMPRTWEPRRHPATMYYS